MTFSHVIYLELARLIVSWQWVTEVTRPSISHKRKQWPMMEMFKQFSKGNSMSEGFGGCLGGMSNGGGFQRETQRAWRFVT
jgi:hypothetical protein